MSHPATSHDHGHHHGPGQTHDHGHGHDHGPGGTTHTPVGLIALAWTLVGVPLAYGLFQTVKTASSLFTG
ncbi:hypothetical protein GB931_12450 [Modestobacter sp. I12A-02628]|uniref:Uncharacterized protein n=1 Tax=Goekera deserti TaxID=2497753 RepID=A0A7K3W966_9ACTN|nr:hypothetical protein [Goekera deserti]MPQ98714.1 hypothetical protein [Goekera deserti]NDI49277.1 hypothetical protein [Goekera deserti]NEL53015.1 hypothetical protein [Goekera deserti]